MTFPQPTWPPQPPVPQDYTYGPRTWVAHPPSSSSHPPRSSSTQLQRTASQARAQAPAQRRGSAPQPRVAAGPGPGPSYAVAGIAGAPAYAQPPAGPPPMREDYWSTELRENSLQLEGVRPTAPVAVEVLHESPPSLPVPPPDSQTSQPHLQQPSSQQQQQQWIPTFRERDGTPDRRRRGRNSHHDDYRPAVPDDDSGLVVPEMGVRASSQPPSSYEYGFKSPPGGRTGRKTPSREPSPGLGAVGRRERETYAREWERESPYRRPSTAHAHQRDRDVEEARRHSDEYGELGRSQTMPQYPQPTQQQYAQHMQQPQHRRHASAVARSQTMPVEPSYVRGPAPRAARRETLAGAGAGAGEFDRARGGYNYGNVGNYADAPEYELGDEDAVDEDDYVLPPRAPGPDPIPTSAQPIMQTKARKKEDTARRIQDWIAGTAGVDEEEYENAADRERPRPSSDGYEYAAYARGQEEDARRVRRDRDRDLHGAGMGGMPITRHASAPAAPALDPGAGAGVPMSDITEEPEEIRPRPPATGGNARYGLRPRPRSPVLDVDDYDRETSASESLSERSRVRGSGASRSSGSMGARMARRRAAVGGTPHPAGYRKLERTDTLRVAENNLNAGSGAYLLPSPRSLNSKSRAPSARTSYEHGFVDTDREAYGHVSISPAKASGLSPSAAAAQHQYPQQSHSSPNHLREYGNERQREQQHHHPSAHHREHERPAAYHTPPITPTRQDYMYRTDGPGAGGRSPYTREREYDAFHPHGHASDPVPTPTRAKRSPSYAQHAQTQAQMQGQVQTPSRAVPASAAYMYRGTSASPATRPPSAAAMSGSVPRTHSLGAAGGYNNANYDSPLAAPRAGRHASRSPSPLHPAHAGASQVVAPAAASAAAAYVVQSREGARESTPVRTHSRAHTPSRAHGHGHGHASISTPTPVSRDRDREAPTTRHRARSTSRPSSRAGVAAPAPAQRNTRVGLWNRRGDHLVEGQTHVVYCPPGRCYPPDLADYPDDAFQDHFGNVVRVRPDAFPELPDSVPAPGQRTAARGYDSFIKYALMPSG